MKTWTLCIFSILTAIGIVAATGLMLALIPSRQSSKSDRIKLYQQLLEVSQAREAGYIQLLRIAQESKPVCQCAQERARAWPWGLGTNLCITTNFITTE